MSNEPSTVNTQIVDSVTGVVTLLAGQAPSQSFVLLDAVMAETLAMAMQNAVSRQQGASVVSSAAVTATCAKMLMANPPGPPPPQPPLPPVVVPLPGPPPDPSPQAAVAAAFAQAEADIDFLKTQAASTTVSVQQQAQDDLNALVTDAGGTVPSQPSPEAAVAAAFAQAEAAIDFLKQQAGTPSVSQQAQADLSALIVDAGGTAPAQAFVNEL